jgi:2,4-dienoyl-CoA reductase-like NADH-dependent reductase (Old Yellow Enzyme family)/NADPH-dependent 2,4-dienoyl-CoA reductase/sulfur reductase-like enzyme
MTFTHIDKPFRLGRSLDLKNRVVRPAHATMFGPGVISDRLIAYHEARAAGGVGLTILEILSVHASSGATLRFYEPGIEDGYRRMVDRIAPYGMPLFQQLYHGGHCLPPPSGAQPWSPSDIPNPKVGIVPIPMTKAMIDDVIEAYARTSRRLEACGIRGVEVHCAHGYLPHQFMSLNANKREDEYGGSLENRARFMLEVLQAIRSEVSPDFVVGARVAPDETVGGVGPAEVADIVEMAEDRGLLDFIHISMGSYHSYAKMIGGMHEPMGYELETGSPIRERARSPVIVVGRFRTLEEADQVIRNGGGDLVGMVRQTIADPDLVRKSFAGQPEKVRPCIGCNQGCVGRPLGVVACAVNPSAGFEADPSLWDAPLSPDAPRRKVFVVGGGPAGMEAARVAAAQGHQVILAEAQPKLGGALRLAASAPTRHGIGDILAWLEQEIYDLGVDVRLSTYVSGEDIAAESPDIVLVATGSTPRMDGVQVSNPGEPIRGIERPNVMSTHDLFLAAIPADARTAVVIDDVGHYEAVAAAETLIANGVAVQYVTRHLSFAPLMDPALMTEPALSRLGRGSFALHTRCRALEIDDEGVSIGPTYEYLHPTSNTIVKLPADLVVFVSANRPTQEVYEELVALGVPARLVGDARTPRFLEAAIQDGRRAGAACASEAAVAVAAA